MYQKRKKETLEVHRNFDYDIFKNLEETNPIILGKVTNDDIIGSYLSFKNCD